MILVLENKSFSSFYLNFQYPRTTYTVQNTVLLLFVHQHATVTVNIYYIVLRHVLAVMVIFGYT